MLSFGKNLPLMKTSRKHQPGTKNPFGLQILLLASVWLGVNAPALESAAESPPVQESTVVEQMQPVRAVQEKGGKSFEPVLVSLRHVGVAADGLIRVDSMDPLAIHLTNGLQKIEVLAPASRKETQRSITVEVDGRALATRSLTLKPVRKLIIYVLPHSHTDIGYTQIQTAVEQKQVNNLLQGIEYARKTANYPEGARFVWNVEVLWAADLYLRRLNDQQRTDFFDAVQKGQVALNGMYLNELTGLCRPEELLRLFRYATELGETVGQGHRAGSGDAAPLLIDSAMISDVPGYTWGTVTAMAQAGIKYLSAAPNYFDRIGDIMVQWENKPFYWMSPSGKDKVLFWIPFKGYALSHLTHKLSREFVTQYQQQLDKMAFPYDIGYLRWSGHGDNAVPDADICDFIKDWNARYTYPKFIIASTSEAFRAFEQRYGSRLPQLRGDLTPYWEDGAGSSALETGINRATSERLTQAETLWAMLNPAGYPAAAFDEAWRNVLLYSEHTWGADCSVWDPENNKTKEQWAIKRSYAAQAETQSQDLLRRALAVTGAWKPGSAIDETLKQRSSGQTEVPRSGSVALDVFNTTSWRRTELVVAEREFSAPGDRVTDEQGKPVPSQRLSTGELAFLANDVPPFAARRYTISPGGPQPMAAAHAIASQTPALLDNGLLRVQVDEKTGGIAELRAKEIEPNLVETQSGHALNDYLFLAGDNLADLQGNRPVKITIKEQGPLVASLIIESEAPGCNRLIREVRLVAGFDYVELLNTVDKQRAPISSKPGDRQFAQKGGKESVNFAFPFHVPEGQMVLDIPLGLMTPELDQLPGSCKNWFTVGRWVEVANNDYGITWVTLDAPLIEVGGITARLLGSQTNPGVWRKNVGRTQTFYSWAMNNHWGTNYRAYQEGPVVFRYVLWPHRRSSPDVATRFARGFSQPLVVSRPPDRRPLDNRLAEPRLRIEPESVTVAAMKPSDDGKAIIVRLFGASGKMQRAKLAWANPAPAQVWLSDTSERPLQKVTGAVPVPGLGMVTLRAEVP